MQGEDIKIVRLTSQLDDLSFDCGDSDLNDFLIRDALDYQNGLIAVTYLVKKQDETIGYVSLANDKISVKDSSKPVWRKIRKNFNRSKHRGDYPAVGRCYFQQRRAGVESRLLFRAVSPQT